MELAQQLRLPYREGFIKNRYVGRTFIMPGQQMRRKNVRKKLNAMALEFTGKNVLLVDGTHTIREAMCRTLTHYNPEILIDSIVRGTTSREIIQMAKEAGAKKVIVASCAPPLRYACRFLITGAHSRILLSSGTRTFMALICHLPENWLLMAGQRPR